jgi:hypothetical protein
VIGFDEGWYVDLIGIFPGVVAFWVAFPFDQILQGLAMPPFLVSADLFYFIFLFSIDQVGWQLGEVRAM